jgi:hypothetical protein
VQVSSDFRRRIGRIGVHAGDVSVGELLVGNFQVGLRERG